MFVFLLFLLFWWVRFLYIVSFFLWCSRCWQIFLGTFFVFNTNLSFFNCCIQFETLLSFSKEPKLKSEMLISRKSPKDCLRSIFQAFLRRAHGFALSSAPTTFHKPSQIWRIWRRGSWRRPSAMANFLLLNICDLSSSHFPSLNSSISLPDCASFLLSHSIILNYTFISTFFFLFVSVNWILVAF